nr:ribosomal protein L6 [Cryptomonas sp. NIES-345]BDA98454.1 ribosomal protein L6 [Cryptomonas sp. NIES-1327]
MSRIGKLGILIPNKVSVIFHDGIVHVKGPRGEIFRQFPSSLTFSLVDSTLKILPNGLFPQSDQLYGTYRSLIHNMIRGVVSGFEKKLELQGIGYRSQLDGRTLVLNVGYSHPVKLHTPEGVKISIENNINIIVSGIDKELVGQTAANIRLVRPPEPYKGKGIRYQGEYVRRKIGKAGKK